jgi:hypothetical protein
VRRAWLIAFLLLLACREKDPIAGTVKKVAEAAEDRDAPAVVEMLSTSYEGRAEIESTLRRYFFAYRSINVSIKDLKTWDNGPVGQARFRVDFAGVPKEISGIDQLVPSSASYQFEVWLTKENGDWKISAAKWQPVGSP